MSEQARDSSQRREYEGRTEISRAEREIFFIFFFFKKMGAEEKREEVKEKMIVGVKGQ